MSRPTVLAFLPCLSLFLSAQGQKLSGSTDSIPPTRLSEVVVRAFEVPKKLISQPAPLYYLTDSALGRFGQSQIFSAINTIPGVRMEERSPASFRINIRGSALQSPFGVRDVKIYYNGIPVTDPTGDTYINQFSFSDFGNMEIIKGSVGSIYGAGIGGTMLISSPLAAHPADTGTSAGIGGIAGSYGQWGTNTFLQWGDSSARNRISYSDLKSDGYRDHTASDLQTLSYESAIQSSPRQELDFIAHYTDLYYQTPGGLTLAQFKSDPRMSRQASGSLPSADYSMAAVFQKNFFAGMSETYHFTPHLENTTSLYGSYTDFINPTFLDYEFRKEPHFGGRTVLSGTWDGAGYQATVLGGMEMQQGYFNVKDFGNSAGSADTLQTDYNANNFTALGFAQADISFAHGWDIQAGASLNFSSMVVTSLHPTPVVSHDLRFQNVFIPRVALSKTFSGEFSAYLNISGGFSPPTLSELLPSTGILNATLQAEKGTDIDLGSRGQILGGRLFYDIDLFLFNLQQSISERVDSSGADYYVNGGGTLQHGLETYLSYLLLKDTHAFIDNWTLWTSQDWSDFHYDNYQVLAIKYSGNPLPGVAPYSMSAGMDIGSQAGIYVHLTAGYQDKIPLNNGNTVFANSYTLLDGTVGWKKRISRNFSLDISAGVDNALNQNYSLGDDLNAAGGKYYNAAPAINYFADFSLRWNP